MAELEERYGQEIEQAKLQYDVLLQEKSDMDVEYEDHIAHMEELHNKQLEELECRRNCTTSSWRSWNVGTHMEELHNKQLEELECRNAHGGTAQQAAGGAGM